TGLPANLPAGSYTVTYDLDGTNTATVQTATMNVDATGNGSFTTIPLATAGTQTDIIITNLASGSCSSAISSINIVSVSTTATPTITGTTPGSRTGTGTVTLITTTSAGTISWFTAATGGSALTGATGTTTSTFVTPSISSTTTYYAETTSGTCTSSPRTAVVATVSAPEINILGNATSITNGNSTPSTSDWTDLGTTDVGVAITKTYTIQNTGNQTLNIDAISFSGTNAADFTVTTAPSTTVAAANSTTFVVRFNPSATGVRSAAISIVTNDPDENPYNFSIQGTGYSGPKLEVYGGTILTTSTTPTTPAVTTTSVANLIASGTTSTNSFTNFGNLPSGNMLIKSYILKNIATTTPPSVHTNDLVFSSASAVTLSGPNADQFSVTKNIIINAKGNSYATLLDETLAPQTYTTIDIAFKPTSIGVKTATISISLSTGSPATYTFTITGTGTTAVASIFTKTKVPTPISSPALAEATATFNFPYVIIYGPDDYLWVTERVRETINRVNKTTGAIDQIADLSTVVWRDGGQDGLLGMALHPQLGKGTGEDYVYVAYTYGGSSANRRLRIARYTYSVTANDGSLASPVVLIENIPASNDHNSGKLLFGSDKKLYYTIGDQGSNQSGNACKENKAQVIPTVAQLTSASPDYTNYPGKIIRMNLDGSIPDDNPIIKGVRSHIFTYGHRNPQGITFGKNGKLYSNEHGPNSDDELNILKSGGNYGWPYINGFRDDKNYAYYPWHTDGSCGSYSNLYFPTPNFKESAWLGTFNPPIATLYTVDNGYNPSGSTLTYTTIAPSCAKMYEGFASEIPGWNNSILMASLKNGKIYRQKLSADGNSIVGEPEELFFSDNRYRDIALDPDGKTLYVITDNSGKTSFPGGSVDSEMDDPGQILKFTYTDTASMLTCTAPIPDVPTLPTISDSCSVTLTAPTASNNCAGAGGIVAVTDAMFPITKQGTTTVVWKYLYGNGQVVTQNQDVTINSTTWNGTAWSNGLPTSQAAIIAGNLTIASDLSACSLTVNNNAVVTVNSGVNVNLNGPLTVSSGSFTLNNNANLIQSTNVNNTGNIIVKRNSSPLMRLDYTLWSSPVTNTNQKLTNFSPLTSVTPTSRFYTYDTTTNLYDDIASPSTTYFNSGQGYLIRMPNNHPTTPTVWNGTFTGVPHNGYYPVAMTNGGVGKRFNLIGNPYPSPISMSQFVLDNNTKITGTLYFWRKTNGASGSAYCTWKGGTFVTNSQAQVISPNGIIQTGQGFFVEAINSSTSIQFNNSQRDTNTSGQFFKTKESKQSTDNEERNTIWVNATNASGAFSQMAVGYITDATQGVDSFDGKHFNDGDVALNSVLNNEDYVIQGRALPFDATDVVPLSFRTTAAGDYSISLDHVDGLFSGDQDIILKDNSTGTETNLKTNSYTFTAPAGSDNARFSLKYQKTLGIDAPSSNEDSIVIYKNKGVIHIKSDIDTIENVKLYDIKGALLFEKTKVNAKETAIESSKYANQILIVKITSNNKKVVTKKIAN
ncbi:MAG TPA: glucose/sorbosone family PQQ-dependent dehydrogenase, partial [Flavobacterium sp.]